MMQQVNLYQGSIRQEHGRTAINRYSAALIASILLLLGMSLYLLWSLGNLKTQMEHTRQNLETEQVRVNSLLSKLPKQENDSVLTSQIEQFQNKINELSQTIQLLTAKNSDTTQGFSQHFQALSNQSIPDVWLSRIYITGPRRIVDLEGSSFKSAQIPYFLQGLQKEPVFHGQTFAKLAMQQSEKIPGQIDFKLNTTTDPQDSDEHKQ